MRKLHLKRVFMSVAIATFTLLAENATVTNISTGTGYQNDLQAALNAVGNGEIIEVSAGDCHPGTNFVNNQYATRYVTKRYTISNKSNVTLRGAGLDKSSLTNLGVENSNNITVLDLKINGGNTLDIRNNAGTRPHNAVRVSGSNDFTLARCAVVNGDAIRITGGSGHLIARNFIGLSLRTLEVSVDDIKLYNNTIYAASEYWTSSQARPMNSVGGFGIVTNGSNMVEIKNNLIYSGTIWGSSTGEGYWTESREILSLGVDVNPLSSNIEGNIFADFNRSLPSDGVVKGWTLSQEQQNNKFVPDPEIIDKKNEGVFIAGYSDNDFVPVEGGIPDVGAVEFGSNGDKFVKADGKKLTVGGEEFRFYAIAFINTFWNDALANGNFMNLKHHRLTDASDFENVRDMGFNSIRFALNADWFTVGNVADNTNRLWDWMDKSIALAEEAGLYIILDMHLPPGKSWLASYSQSSLSSQDWVWNSTAKQNHLKAIWTEIATRYKDNETVAAYELLNEPKTTDRTGDQWFNVLAPSLIEAVRSVDQNHLIIANEFYGSLHNDATAKPGNKIYADDNILYDQHFYYDGQYTHKAAKWSGDVDNGSWYSDEYWVHGDDYLDKVWNKNSEISTPFGSWSNSVKDYGWKSKSLNQWNKLETAPLEITAGGEVGMFLPILSVNPNKESNVNAEVLFDEITLLEKRVGAAVWDTIRYFPVKSEFVNSDKKLTKDGFMPIEWQDGYATFTVKNGDDRNSADGDNVSYGIKNVTGAGFAGDYDYSALWQQSWLGAIKPKVGYEYKLSVYVKFIGSAAERDNCLYYGPELVAYKGGKYENGEVVPTTDGTLDESWYRFDKNYLKNKMYMIDWASNNNVPVSVFEYGIMDTCFGKRNDTETYGGEAWLTDVKNVMDNNLVSFSMWAYRNLEMGLYNTDGGGNDNFVNFDNVNERNNGIYDAVTKVMKFQTRRNFYAAPLKPSQTIYEYDFENGLNGWANYAKSPEAQAAPYVMAEGANNNALTTYISQTGSDTWHIHARKTGIPVESGSSYTVTLKARTEAGFTRKIGVKVEENGGSYTCYGKSEFTINGDLKTYTFSFTSPASDWDAVICVEMGNFGGDRPLDVVIDDIKITK